MKKEDDYTISTGVLRRRLNRHGDKAKFARQMGVTQANLTNWFGRGIPAKQFGRVCKALGLTPAEYMSEEDGLIRASLRSLGEPADVLPLAIWEEGVPGEAPLHSPTKPYGTLVRRIFVNRDWLENSFPRVSNIEKDLFLFTVPGDRMAPTFSDRDAVLVDSGDTTAERSGVFLFWYHKTFLAARLQAVGDGLMILSDNKVYEPITVLKEDLGNIRIVGRIIWVWAGRRL